MLANLEQHPDFKQVLGPLLTLIVEIAQCAHTQPLTELLTQAENCTEHVRALAALISENGMLAGDLVLPLYIYGVSSVMECESRTFSVYHNLIHLQYRFQSFGDDNDACQLTHIIAAAIVIPPLFDIVLLPSSQ